MCRQLHQNQTRSHQCQVSPVSILQQDDEVFSPEKPVEEWADDIKPMFVIQGLLDSFGPGSKDTTYCRYCKEEGETTPATSWCSVCDDALCERCLRMHNRNPSSRHHDVVDMPREVKVRRRRRVMCKDHKDEDIKLMCKDCKKAVCQTCCIIYHRDCKCVVEIEKEIPSMKSELTRNKNNLMKKYDEIEALVDKQKTRSKEESTRYLQMESDIKSTTKKAIDVIKGKERKLLDELKKMSDKHMRQLKADIKSGELSVQMYQQQAELIDQTLLSECDMDVYEMYQGCEVGDVDAVGDADLKEKGRIARIMFRQDTDKLSRALDDLQLGEIDVQYEGVLDLKATPVLQDNINVLDLKATPVLQDTMDVRVAGDGNAADATDVTVLVVNVTDTVVVTDFNNTNVKSFYTRNNKACHSRLSLGSRPCRVTKVKHNQVAVTLPDTSQIVTVEVNPDLVLLSTITTYKQYRGITSLTSSTLAAGPQFPPCVDNLDMSGHNAYNILQYPFFLCTTRKGDILVSDWGSKCVVCLTPGGDVVFTYRPPGDTILTFPCGITSTSTGDILVTDNSPDRIIHLTESGEFVRNILTSTDGIECPIGMCLDGRGCMYVCSSRVVKAFSLH